MKTKYILVILVLFVGLNVFSQHHGKGKNKDSFEAIKAERIAFFTGQIGLTPEEAEKFWPLFNEFDEKRDEINRKKRDAIYKLSDNESLTKKEIENYTTIIVHSFQEEADLIEKYDKKFKEILPIEKVGKIYIAEHNFRRHLFKKLKDR